jgi:ribosomal protein L30/L7E
MHQSVEVDMENPAKAGMVNKVAHLLKIEEI